MTYRLLAWDDKDARLKGFSATAKSDTRSIVKIEIEVRDPYRLGALLQDLSEIRREQAAADRPSATDHHVDAPAPKRTASRRKIASQRPLLLTYRGD
jgi:hypothetical protein